MKIPDIAKKIPVRNSPRKKGHVSAERTYMSKILILSVLAIIASLVIVWAILFVAGEGVGPAEILKGSLGSIFALFFAVIFLDNINAYNDKRKRKRDERKAVVRHNRIVQPIIDMYLVRKNMVITPNDKTVRKFQIDSTFTIKDMRDMYGQSELISDVGKSKIEIYAFHQDKLNEKLTNLVEEINFDYYSDLCDAAMEFITATSYGASAMNAILGYQDAMAGTKSMKSVLLNMLREEPENGKFATAQPALKNLYLVHQMINDQEKALVKYLKLIQQIIEEDDADSGKSASSDADYE
ncbi:hypothetical protein Mpt1_c04580 [Candidatus Methanoplasma termitum]|uniref:Uncharacterized protein n=1 Tax=Candidatus Methanoplasma termitum TaxID=1577791 RepID=A0A0A7LB09_9ARCH|nr:hypothetical protein [Candidatus Methanoplasma termitum]AIZ56350.1 hypothetical protein Mpt1_c04580 [Candidatus Methanoplasma termitum]